MTTYARSNAPEATYIDRIFRGREEDFFVRIREEANARRSFLPSHSRKITTRMATKWRAFQYPRRRKFLSRTLVLCLSFLSRSFLVAFASKYRGVFSSTTKYRHCHRVRYASALTPPRCIGRECGTWLKTC